MAYDVFHHKGHVFRLNIEFDDTSDPPWKRDDGHGPVSEWTVRSKKAGERILSTDHGLFRYYDVQEAQEIALRDGWGLADEAKATLAKRLGKEPASLTQGEIAAEAVRHDYERLRDWCLDRWHYVGVIVTYLPDGEDDAREPDYAHALWGVEDDCDDYVEEVARELADDVVSDLDTEASEREHWANQGVRTAELH